LINLALNKSNCIACFILFFLITNTVAEESILNKIQDNWNNTKSMSGSFIQIVDDNEMRNGNFYFLKPYLAKFVYDNRNEDIITNERLLRIVDKEGYQIDSYLIGNHIMKSLLSDKTNIIDNLDVSNVTQKNGNYQIAVLFDKGQTNAHVVLSFDNQTLDLKKWEITDEFMSKTVLEFTKIKKNIFISENLFDVKYRN
tara:strand:+ start:1108 stop:1701 length:594 start_codon:yes stop_codon:yes gene_type:complete